MKLLYLYSLSVFSPLCVAIKMDPGFNLNEDNVLEETPFSKVEGTIHRALESTFLNSCDTLTDNSQCCVGQSTECVYAGDGGTFEVDTGSCRTIGITCPFLQKCCLWRLNKHWEGILQQRPSLL